MSTDNLKAIENRLIDLEYGPGVLIHILLELTREVIKIRDELDRRLKES